MRGYLIPFNDLLVEFWVIEPSIMHVDALLNDGKYFCGRATGVERSIEAVWVVFVVLKVFILHVPKLVFIFALVEQINVANLYFWIFEQKAHCLAVISEISLVVVWVIFQGRIEALIMALPPIEHQFRSTDVKPMTEINFVDPANMTLPVLPRLE